MRRSFVLLLAASTALTVVVATSPADASGSITFYGSGNGHGIGLSQWGAYGLAQEGWSHRRILTHFYTGTGVSSNNPLPRRVRVGLTTDVRTIHLQAGPGSVRLWVGDPLTGTAVGTIPQGQTFSVRPASDGSFRVRDASGDVVGGRRWGNGKDRLYATYADTGSRVFVPEADQVSGTGFTYAHGRLELDTYGCATRCRERLVLRIRFEQYLLGISEVPNTWPRQALQTQAVASRTYAAYAVERFGKRSDCACDLTDGGNDQTYVGWSKESSFEGDRWVSAVKKTEGQVVTYKGELIQAFFTSSDGGYTENVEDAWHGGDPRYAIPYLRGVCDPGENTSANPWESWNRTFTLADATARLRGSTGDIGTFSTFSGDVRGVSGRIITVVAHGDTGRATITGSELRAAFGLPDDRVWFDKDKNVLGAIRVEYDDLNCRPGVPTSQELVLADGSGSRQRFEKGAIYDNTAASVTVWIRGTIYDEYRAVGEVMGVLGLPSDVVVALTSGADGGCDGCQMARFQGGRIYANPDTGTHALWGPLLAAYLDRGGPGGALGYPTSRVTTAGDGSTSATFQHGAIACPAGGACTVS
jgi:SpoIID/LytB domain protein